MTAMPLELKQILINARNRQLHKQATRDAKELATEQAQIMRSAGLWFPVIVESLKEIPKTLHPYVSFPQLNPNGSGQEGINVFLVDLTIPHFSPIRIALDLTRHDIKWIQRRGLTGPSVKFNSSPWGRRRTVESANMGDAMMEARLASIRRNKDIAATVQHIQDNLAMDRRDRKIEAKKQAQWQREREDEEAGKREAEATATEEQLQRQIERDKAYEKRTGINLADFNLEETTHQELEERLGDSYDHTGGPLRYGKSWIMAKAAISQAVSLNRIARMQYVKENTQ